MLRQSLIDRGSVPFITFLPCTTTACEHCISTEYLELAGAYRFGFNGKERDDEMYDGGSMYDYGFRIYDSRNAKFLSVDPLFREYAWNSTYSYAENSPIKFVDLDGAERAYKKPDGTYVTPGDNFYRAVPQEGLKQFQLDGGRPDQTMDAFIVGGIVSAPILATISWASLGYQILSNSYWVSGVVVSAAQISARYPNLVGDAATFTAELFNPTPAPVESPYKGEELAQVLKGAGKYLASGIGKLLTQSFEKVKISKNVVGKVKGTFDDAAKKFDELTQGFKSETTTDMGDGKLLKVRTLEDGTNVTLRNFGEEAGTSATIQVSTKADAQTKGVEVKFFEEE